MDKAIAGHAGGRGSNPDKTKEDFICLENFNYVFLSSWVPHHVLSLTPSLNGLSL